MKRKMIYASVFYMLGLFFASFYTNWLILPFSAGFCAILYVALRKKIKGMPLIIFSFIAGLAVYTAYSVNVYDKISAFDGKKIYFSGKIENVEHRGADSSVLMLKGRINDGKKAKILLYWEDYDCCIGDEIEFDAAVSKPKSDYLFDSESYYKSQKIFLTADSPENLKITKYSGFNLKRRLAEYRESIIFQFNRKLGSQEGSFLAGMVFGEKSGIEYNEKTALYRCGIGHIMAVSGLHVSLAAFIILWLLKKMNAGRYGKFTVLVVFLPIMVLTVNSSYSVIRAAIMLLIAYLARVFLRQNDIFNSLAIAALIISIANPFVILNSGFLLSVSGTFGIGVLAPYFCQNAEKKIVKDAVGIICASAAVMLPSVYYFGEFSLLSFATNLLIVPLCLMAIVIGMIFTLSGGYVSLLFIVKYIIRLIIFISDFLSRLKFSHITCSRDIFPLLAVLFLIAVLVHITKKNKKLTAIVISVGVAVFSVISVADICLKRSEFTVAVLGSGNNAVICVTDGENTDIFDLSGSVKSTHYLEKYLSSMAVDEVDSLYLTKRQNSLFSAYNHNIFADITEIHISGGHAFSENCGEFSKPVFYEDDSFEITRKAYTATYSDGIFKICHKDRTISFADCGCEEITDSALRVYGGKLSENDFYDSGGIYLCQTDKNCINGLNNFIITEKSGDFVIRRL